jgi:CubicO group peptidase (beta-lactamase class C family)
MRILLRTRPLAVALLLAALTAVAVAAAESPAGRWRGRIEIPGRPLEVAVTLRQAEDGAWSGSIDIPAQNAQGLPLGGILIELPRVEFAMTGVPGSPVFVGELASDGAVIAGEFRQGGAAFPFRLDSAESPAARARVALEGLESEISADLERFFVPSIAVAVVAGDEVVLAEGYGLRDVEGGLPATADTLYAIGSVTKSFTSALVGTLADEGKLDLDQPVWELLPEFRLADPARTASVTVRDLLAHRTGLPRHDFGWYGEDLDVTREDLVRRLRHLQANQALRARWQYQNWMYTTAGALAGRLAGSSWEEAVRERLLAPLGMERTRLSCAERASDPDRAGPYVEQQGELSLVACREFPAMSPAGSLHSSAREMALWLRMQLAGGAVGERRVLEESTARELQSAQMVLPEGGPDREVLAHRYAMGWFTDVYRGHRRLHHGGNIDGFSARVTFFPDDDFGVVVLANLGGTPVPALISAVVADRLLELEPIDWRERIGERWEAARAASEEAEQQSDRMRREGTVPPRPLEEYAGEYGHPGYGRVVVEQVGDGDLTARFHGIEMPLEHWHFETFRAGATDKALADLKLFVQFVADTSGEIVRLEAPLEPLAEPIAFARQAPARLSDPQFLRRLTGSFELEGAPQVARFQLAGDRLRLVLPGQPVWELQPLRATEFEIEALSGYRIRFRVEGDRPVDEVEFLQPNGVFSARRLEDR